MPPVAGRSLTPIPLGSESDPGPVSAATNPTLLGSGASARSGAAAPPLPERIGQFKVVREIGAGGMGHVLKCLETSLNRYVALKLLRPALARNAAFIERFRREAHAVAKLRHPNIVQIYAIGEDGGHDYFTMEYVDGEGLDRVLARRGRLPEREALQIGAQVCRGLAAAHDAGILHRDVKPGNVLVNGDGRAQLSDFGLAKFEFQQTLRRSAEAASAGIAPGDPSATDPGRVMGTPFYMAPELIAGRDADARSDVYAVGVMLYELLAGHVPFRHSDVEGIFDQHLHELPRSIADANPEVSLETANLIYRALEKDPRNRFPDAAAMADALEAGLDRERRARELQTQARLSAEMATAFGALRGGREAPRVSRLITWALLLVLLLGALYLVMQGLQVPAVASPIPGSAQGDRAFEAGAVVRVAGIVNEVQTDAAWHKIALLGPLGERWVQVSAEGWRAAHGGEPPAEDSWWAAEGPVVRGAGDVVAVHADATKVWAVDGLEFSRVTAVSNSVRGFQYEPVKRVSDAMLGDTMAVRGVVVWRDDGEAGGPVDLLLVRGGEEALALRVHVTAAARRGMASLARCRVGEPVHAIGRLTELALVPGVDPALAAGLLLTVEDPEHCWVLTTAGKRK